MGKGVACANFGEAKNPYRAAIRLEAEPLARGEGVRYVSNVSFGYLTKSFQKAVEEAVYESCKRGLYGWEITDILITLTDAIFDSVTSTPSDFRNLTPIVFKEALSQAQTKLLEPIYRFDLTVPGDVAGKAMSDMQNMRAEITETVHNDEVFLIKGHVPIDTAKDYTVKLASYTEGKGILMMRFAWYADVSEECAGEEAKKRMKSLRY